MNDETLEQLINKARILRELHRAKIRVRQLERRLRGEPAEVEIEPEVPGFLRGNLNDNQAHGAGYRFVATPNRRR